RRHTRFSRNWSSDVCSSDLECISCGACIDACDDVMDKMGYERGLIRYTTQNALDGRRSRILRPRIAIYAVLLLVLVGGWAWGIEIGRASRRERGDSTVVQ